MREICQIDHDPCDTLHSIGWNWECEDEDAGIEDSFVYAVDTFHLVENLQKHSFSYSYQILIFQF